MEELWFKVRYYLLKLAYFKKRSRLKRFGLPLILILLSFGLISFNPRIYRQLINSQTLALLVLLFVVTISSWYGGIGPGAFATLITSFINFFKFMREDAAYHPLLGDYVLTGIYGLIGIMIAIISEVRYELDLQKDEFIGLAAHELKTPLTIIKGFAGLLQQSFKKPKNRQEPRYIEEINMQSDKLLELINDFLDVTKIDVGKLVYHDELFNFDSLVKEIVSHQRIVHKNRDFVLTKNMDKIIKGDRYRIGQVITNLLTNAIKYSPSKSPIEIKVKTQKDGVVLSVKDYGIGIPKKEQKRIFEQLYRTRGAQKGKPEGLGLGLFISSQIVKRHQGRLYVKSYPQKGSIFFLELPLGH